jgi:O-glycosyl hydrolase
MTEALRYVNVAVDAAQDYQTIDGFGVNINSKYWGAPAFDTALELLVDGLGATLYRVDIWGKSDWADTGDDVYTGDTFRKGWAMMRYLNERGIEPYLTASGDVPRWMLAPDGKTLAAYDEFCEMLVSMVEWARRREGLRFRYFGPLNETDIGSPEGPSVSAQEFVRVMETLDRKLAGRGLDDIRLVVAEQANFNADYVRELLTSEPLRQRIGVLGMHTYRDIPPEEYAAFMQVAQPGLDAGMRLWMGEYGDLDQSGEKEWYVAWASTTRLLGALEAGFTGAMVWDAFDNVHDHDGAWTIYGLLRTGLRLFTPKKRYFAARQVYRYVRPGFRRIAVRHDSPDLRVLAFASSDRKQATLVGYNASPVAVNINANLAGFGAALLAGNMAYYRTSEAENCVRVAEAPVRTGNWPYTGIDVQVPAWSIFTLSNAS